MRFRGCRIDGHSVDESLQASSCYTLSSTCCCLLPRFMIRPSMGRAMEAPLPPGMLQWPPGAITRVGAVALFGEHHRSLPQPPDRSSLIDSSEAHGISLDGYHAVQQSKAKPAATSVLTLPVQPVCALADTPSQMVM